jgi:hypothetical protein
MKTIFAFLSVFFLLTMHTFADVITVSNLATNTAMYSNLQLALDAAKVNDTVYVHGSPTSYGNGSIRKRITLIGAGYAAKETQFQFSTRIDNLYLDSTTIGGIGGTGEPIIGVKITGIHITSNLSSNNSPSAANGFIPKRNVVIERCKISNLLSVTGSNWTIINNWINIIDINNWSNVLVSNNFIYTIGQTNQSSVLFIHNVFLPNGSGSTVWSGNVSYAIFSYNIFLNNNPTFPSLNYCTFNSNIIGNATPLVLVTTVNNNTGADNFNNINPLFSELPTGTNPPPSRIDDITADNYNFRLSANSVGKGKGSGGTDIGVYGGDFPFQGIGGASTLPQITRMDISNSVLPKTDKLKVTFKARKVN